MELGELSIRVWQTKWRTLLFALLAIAIGILFTYRVSFSPPSLRAKALRFGVAQATLMVDAAQSPLATANVAPARMNLLASDIALATSSNLIADAVARAVHAQPDEIGIGEQIQQNLPRTLYYAHEAEVGTQLLADQHRYSVQVRNVQGTFIIQLFTQAPTGALAIKMANVVSRTMSDHIAQLVRRGEIPTDEQLVLRRLGDATGGLVDPTATRDLLVLIALVSFVLLMIAGFTADRVRLTRSPVSQPPAATPAAPPHPS